MKLFKLLCVAIVVPLTMLSSNLYAHPWSTPKGAVFTQTNDATNNEVLMYSRNGKGELTFAGAYSPGGLGTSGGLGNQGSLVLGPQNKLLFVANAGSNEISVMALAKRGLSLINKVNSGGDRPVSITVFQDMLYVLHAGSDSINGFTIADNGSLTPIEHSMRVLSSIGTAPAQIQFSPWGDVLAVTEKATNLIDIFSIDETGLPNEAVTNTSIGNTPFGFDFDRRGRLIVSEAAGGAADAGSMSSYQLLQDGILNPISAAIDTTETAACWAIVSPNGRYAYTTNAGSSSISGYRILHDGRLKLLDEDGVTAATGENTNPLDMAMSRNGRHLYAISPRTNAIVAFKVKRRGGLHEIQTVEVPAERMNGLAGF